jgi:hypothetical protein
MNTKVYEHIGSMVRNVQCDHNWEMFMNLHKHIGSMIRYVYEYCVCMEVASYIYVDTGQG